MRKSSAPWDSLYPDIWICRTPGRAGTGHDYAGLVGSSVSDTDHERRTASDRQRQNFTSGGGRRRRGNTGNIRKGRSALSSGIIWIPLKCWNRRQRGSNGSVEPESADRFLPMVSSRGETPENQRTFLPSAQTAMMFSSLMR